MGLITLPGFGRFQKAIFNIWFRVPAATMAAAAAGGAGQLSGIVPLLVFGPRNIVPRSVDISATVVSSTYTINHRRLTGLLEVPSCSFEITGSGSGNMLAQVPEVQQGGLWNPSFIGISCDGERNTLFGWFIQDRAARVSEAWGDPIFIESASANALDTVDDPRPAQSTMDACGIPYHFPPGEGAALDPVFHHVETRNYASALAEFPDLNPEIFVFGGTVDIDNNSGAGIDVTPDEWHCLTLSTDFRTVRTRGFRSDVFVPGGRGEILETSKLYAAFDDVNLVGRRLSTYLAPATDNDWISVLGMSIYQQFTQATTTDEPAEDGNHSGYDIQHIATGIETPRYDYSPDGLPTDTFYIPGIDANRDVMMGPLTIVKDVTLDTSVTANRRAFVTDKGKPTKPGDIEDFFGKKPEIMFYRRSDWVKANNIGSLGDGTPEPEGIVTGTIKRYTPEPELGK